MKTKISLIMILMSTSLLFTGCAGIAYKKATEKNSIIAFRYFVTKYPDSEYTPQAKKKIEELYWQQKMNQNTISAYETYLQDYPQGKYVKEAKVKIEDMVWDSAKTIQDYKHYLKEYPVGKYAKEAKVKIEDMVWAEVQASNDLAAFDLYLGKYPKGRFVAQAIALAEENAWKDAVEKDQKELYEAFIARFFDSEYLADAKQKLENVIWNNAEKARTDIGLYQEYLDRYPNGLYAKEARDCVDWEKFEGIGTPESFSKYLSLHPKGRFFERARGYLENYDKPAPKKLDNFINSIIDGLANGYYDSLLKMLGGGTLVVDKESNAKIGLGGNGNWSKIEVNEHESYFLQGAIHYWTVPEESSAGSLENKLKIVAVPVEGAKCRYEVNTYKYSNGKWYYDLGNETYFKSR